MVAIGVAIIEFNDSKVLTPRDFLLGIWSYDLLFRLPLWLGVITPIVIAVLVRIHRPIIRFVIIGISLVSIPHFFGSNLHWILLAFLVGTVSLMFRNTTIEYFGVTLDLKLKRPLILRLLIWSVFVSIGVLGFRSQILEGSSPFMPIYDDTYYVLEFVKMSLPIIIGTLLLVPKQKIRIVVIGLSIGSIVFYAPFLNYYPIILISGILVFMFLKPIRNYFQELNNLQLKNNSKL